MSFIKTLLPIAALAFCGLATAGSRDVNTVTVKYGDLNLNSQAGVASLHKRLRNAAESVCSQYETRILGLKGAYDACVADAVAQGVASIGNANLTHFHAVQGKTVVLASN